jgi:hypothetical protein
MKPKTKKHPRPRNPKPQAKGAKKRTIRQTSDRVSRIAAKVLRKLADEPGKNLVFPLENGLGCIDAGDVICTVAEFKALAASCLNQDQTPGKCGRKAGKS